MHHKTSCIYLSVLFVDPVEMDTSESQGKYFDKEGEEYEGSLDEVYTPMLSSSAPELQGEWKEVKRRMKDRKEKMKKVSLLQNVMLCDRMPSNVLDASKIAEFTHYHTMLYFDALKIYSCGKDCEKKRNCL